MKTVTKPWGSEIWIAHNEQYVMKIININKGFRTSLQKHVEKRETHYVEAGTLRFTLGDSAESLTVNDYGPGSAIDVFPGQIHRLEAIEDVRIFEVSTPQVDDVIRLSDDWARPDGRIDAEHSAR